TLEDGGKIYADGALIGVGALSIDGNATVNIDGDIDPPLIGGIAVTDGNGTALANSSGDVDADLFGVVALNIGDGQAHIQSSSELESSNDTGIIGLAAVKVSDANGAGSDV